MSNTNTAVNIPQINLAVLHQHLQQLLSARQLPRDQWLLQLLQLLIAVTNSAGAAYVQQQEGAWQLEERVLSTQALKWHPDLTGVLTQCVAKACEQDRLQLELLDEAHQVWVIATPLVQMPEQAGIAMILLLGEQAIETFATILQLFANYALLPITPAPPPQVALSLLTGLLAAPDLPKAYSLLINSLQRALGCQRVFIGEVRGLHCRMQAVSEMKTVQHHAESIRALENLMDVTRVSGKVLDHTAPEIQRVCQLLNASQAFSIPLMYQEKVGQVLILIWTEPMSSPLPTWLPQILPSLGLSFAVIRRAQPNLLQRIRHNLWSSHGKLQRGFILLIPISLIALAFLPVPHNITVKTTIEPQVRRFVTAPFEGILKNTLHEAGDIVKEGEILARLDEREIEWTVTGVKADRGRAQKQKDVSSASRDTAAAQIAQLEMDRLDVQLALLEYKSQHLDIKSPLQGIVIKGDLKRVAGSPVNKGQSLFEIAPLQSMVVEVAIAMDDISYVRPEMAMTLSLDAYPQQQWALNLRSIHPRAVQRDTQYVFTGEAQLENADGKLRPGMKGQAKIHADHAALGWVLLHKVWEQVWRWL